LHFGDDLTGRLHRVARLIYLDCPPGQHKVRHGCSFLISLFGLSHSLHLQVGDPQWLGILLSWLFLD
jgi:hypothetical protein